MLSLHSEYLNLYYYILTEENIKYINYTCPRSACVWKKADDFCYNLHVLQA